MKFKFSVAGVGGGGGSVILGKYGVSLILAAQLLSLLALYRLVRSQAAPRLATAQGEKTHRAAWTVYPDVEKLSGSIK